MEYEALANELLSACAGMRHNPENQHISRMIRGEHFVLNYLLARGGQARPKQISTDMNVSTARIAVLLRRLEKKGFITRTGDPKDNRRIVVTLLEEGRREVERARAELLRCVAGMLEQLGPEDAKTYVRIQKKLIRNRRQP